MTIVCAGIAVVLAAGSSMTADTPQGRPITGRSQVATRLGIVAASQPLAARPACRCSSAAATPSTRPSRPTR